MYLSLLVETGIGGLAALVWLNVAILRAARRAARAPDARRSFFRRLDALFLVRTSGADGFPAIYSLIGACCRCYFWCSRWRFANEAAILDQFSDPGGAQQALMELLPAMRERGWDAAVSHARKWPAVRPDRRAGF